MGGQGAQDGLFGRRVTLPTARKAAQREACVRKGAPERLPRLLGWAEAGRSRAGGRAGGRGGPVGGARPGGGGGGRSWRSGCLQQQAAGSRGSLEPD